MGITEWPYRQIKKLQRMATNFRFVEQCMHNRPIQEAARACRQGMEDKCSSISASYGAGTRSDGSSSSSEPATIPSPDVSAAPSSASPSRSPPDNHPAVCRPVPVWPTEYTRLTRAP